MRSRIYRIALCLLTALLLLVWSTVPVYAIADPDNPSSINTVYVYENLIETGDTGVLIEYYIDYAALPTELASDTYLGTFVDTDGVTPLRTVSPYVFGANNNKGYRAGLMWIYFNAADTTSLGLDDANEALYRVWVSGNPTAGWAGDPPITVGAINEGGWSTISDPSVLLAAHVLIFATQFETNWTLDLIEATSLNNRLTDVGVEYFTNAIPDLRLMAPNCFPAGTYMPVIEDLDTSTSFGATAEDGTGTIAVSPTTFVEGSQSLNVTGVGTIIFTLNRGTVGTVTTDVGIITDSPVDIVYGVNTVTATGVGNVTVDVNLEDTQAQLAVPLSGTGFDLTTMATSVGMSRWMFSGMVWMIMAVVMLAGVYGAANRTSTTVNSGKLMLPLFDVWIIGGSVLGLLHPIVAALMFIGAVTFTGYVLFFRSANV